MTANDVPIACSLGAGDYQARIAWIAELNTRALTSHRREGLVLHLEYRTEALAEVQELVRRESACCGFLRFDLHPAGRVLNLTVTAPPEAEGAAETLFDAFIGRDGEASASSCACA
jgi:hypothetical protein